MNSYPGLFLFTESINKCNLSHVGGREMNRTFFCLSDAFHLSFSMTKNRKNTIRLFFKNLTKVPFPNIQNKSARDMCTLCGSLPPLIQWKIHPPPMSQYPNKSRPMVYGKYDHEWRASNLSVESPKPQMDKPATVVPSLPPQHTNIETPLCTPFPYSIIV